MIFSDVICTILEWSSNHQYFVRNLCLQLENPNSYQQQWIQYVV